MKDITKSTYLKSVVCAIFICCIVFMSYDISQNAHFIGNSYSFERSYQNSKLAIEPITDSLDTAYSYISGNISFSEAKDILSEKRVHYYIKIYDNVLSDSDDELDEKSFDVPCGISVISENGEKTVTRGFDQPVYTVRNYDTPKTGYKIYLRLEENYEEQIKSEWDYSKNAVISLIYHLSAMIFIMLLCFVYFICVCGRKKDYDGVKMLKTDKIYTEINLFIILMFGILTTLLLCFGALAGIENNKTDDFNNFIILAALGSGLSGGVTLYFTLGAIRNIKNRTFLKRTLIYKIYLFIKGGLKKLEKSLSKKTIKTTMLYLSVYTLIVAIACKIFDGAFLIACIIALVCAYVFLEKRFLEFDLIREELKEIKSGNTNAKTDVSKFSSVILKETAEDINELGDGIQKAVNEQLKAERMKSELITNVSHDLKTPLTSIISYSDLLCKESLKPDEANDYAKIIKEKSLRLKNLTSDLFDISKVQSGNEQILKENIDAALILSQTVGEADEQIKNAGLEFVMNIPDEKIMILADGKKLSRVFENLVMNAVKYAMKKTRVYIDLKIENNKCVIEMKNISSYPLNFDDNEITKRFVRGDISRSTEGNGLGLAIAKSYTEACGGSFKIITDGDLFKARIEFEIL